MDGKNTVGTNIKGIDKNLHNAIKVKAILRNLSVNDMYLEVLSCGAKEMKIVKDIK